MYYRYTKYFTMDNLKIPEHNKNVIVRDSQPGSDEEFIPADAQNKADEVTRNLLPVKSTVKYETTYKKFMLWRTEKKSLSESVFPAYFSELATKQKPSSVWAIYSQLRSTIHLNHNINIHDYGKVIAFLKRNSTGFQSKKANVLSPENINKFMNQAPDEVFLATKVALILGIQGACRRDELCYITLNNLEDKGDMVVVKIPFTKTNKPRSFIVTNDFYHYYKKYAALRPKDTPTNRFFVTYRNGPCSKQVIGINTFGNMTKSVATYLNLENPESYTGHTFRRTSATLLADSGADLLTLKRHGGWKSSNVAEGYVEESLMNKKKIGQQIAHEVLHRSTSNVENSKINLTDQSFSIEDNSVMKENASIEDNSVMKENVSIKTNNPSKSVNLHFHNCNHLSIILDDNRNN